VHFKRHSSFNEGDHAFLSPSTYHWINYSLEKLESRWKTSVAAALGTEQHRYAAEAIDRGLTQPGNTILDLYINDCIRFRMHTEVILYYSNNCFGTADAIAFRYRKLRISDLKTGVSPTSVHQLEVYAALFCLEYNEDPFDFPIELRIYQSDEIREYVGDPEVIAYIMEKIIEFDQTLNKLRQEDEQS
jgi:hypothetical protein